MKIKDWHLIGLSVFIFFLDLLTLGNRQVIDNQVTNKIAFVIALLCVFTFLFGIIKTVRNIFSHRKVVDKIKIEQEEKQGSRATGVEIRLRKLVGVLLIVSVSPLLLFGPYIILGLPNLFLALYLLLNRRYHLLFDGLLVFIGCVGFYLNNLTLYKKIELSVCPGLININEILIVNVIPGLITSLFLLAPLFLFVGDIIARLKLAHKERLCVISLITIVLALLFLPFLHTPRVALGEATGGGTGGGKGGLQHFSAWNTQFLMSYDQTLKSYIFTAQMPNQDSNNSSSITNICVDGNLISITKENDMLQVDNGVISDGKISVAPGQTATIKLVSQKPFYVVSLFEGIFHYLNSFLK
ncbi:MAG: hypothetical protein ABIJ82_03020 [Patescibacteria group bacterium]|nr:hypothetical protein [Patescibacteria group bacterium]MBU1953155.1 hypothetical protein [Patescibacteria group bacterium]